MNKATLIRSAEELGPFSKSLAQEYAAKSSVLNAQINFQLMQRSDINQLTGSGNLDMMQDNHANHVRFIAFIIKHFHAHVLVETILWVFRAYRSRGFSSLYWAAQLNTWIRILNEQLSEESFAGIYPLYAWMQIHIPDFEKLAAEESENPYIADPHHE